jgi:hypothetical protein
LRQEETLSQEIWPLKSPFSWGYQAWKWQSYRWLSQASKVTVGGKFCPYCPLALERFFSGFWLEKGEIRSLIELKMELWRRDDYLLASRQLTPEKKSRLKIEVAGAARYSSRVPLDFSRPKLST